jgi:ubiquinone/menaquinone biosynthesis C-methylase UbiE
MNARRLADAVCPGLLHPQVRYKQLLRELLKPGVRWLDLGCGHELIRPWALSAGEDELSFTRVPALSVGIDSDGPALWKHQSIPHRVAGNIAALPFKDASFDLITANMVIEHVEDPAIVLAEVRRVLRPKGVFVFHTPHKYYPPIMLARLVPERIKSRLVAFIEHRDESDVYPTRYRMNSAADIRRHAEAAGFTIIRWELLETLSYTRWRVLFLLNLALAWLLRRPLFRKCQADFLVALGKP